MIYQQGNVRYKHEDEIKIKRESNLEMQLDGTFHFDPDISPENRFITFKATVIGRNLNLASGDEPTEEEASGEELFVSRESKSRATGDNSKAEVNTHIKKRAEFMQKDSKFPSEGARRLDAAYREVDLMSNQLGLTLVATRQKLQPFVDDGVIYKDRKIVSKKLEESKKNRRDAELDERIVAYKEKIQETIENSRLFELEQVMNELTLSQDDNPENLKIYKELRMNIIHGQICLASFFKWKRDMRQY